MVERPGVQEPAHPQRRAGLLGDGHRRRSDAAPSGLRTSSDFRSLLGGLPLGFSGRDNLAIRQPLHYLFIGAPDRRRAPPSGEYVGVLGAALQKTRPVHNPQRPLDLEPASAAAGAHLGLPHPRLPRAVYDSWHHSAPNVPPDPGVRRCFCAADAAAADGRRSFAPCQHGSACGEFHGGPVGAGPPGHPDTGPLGGPPGVGAGLGGGLG
mmetsp:Transcript_41397/g.108829  ORF Transcript_41397/g.108829 Transcript_41397/m.108829 type:complete len:209 (-) Transcript_41397:4046-4672(-)